MMEAALDNNELLLFLKAIDDELAKHAGKGETVNLYLLGRAALILGYGLSLMTKDIDIVHTHNSPLQEIAEMAFGRDTPTAARWGFYLESVSSGLPPLPLGYQSRCVDVEGDWAVIRPKRPEPNDLAVTKLGRFHAKDREDLRILSDRGLLNAVTLKERLDQAHLWSEEGDPKSEAAYRNLGIVIDYLEGRRPTI
jgi:hypothetical protein